MINARMILWSIALPALTLIQGDSGFDKTISSAMTLARSEQRHLMLYFTSKPCLKCKSLDAYFEQHHVQKSLSENYVVVKVDIEDFDGRACREIYEIDEVPALLVIDINGKILYKSEGNVTQQDIDPIVSTGVLPENNDKKSISSSPGTISNKKSNNSTEIYSIQIGYFSSSENADKLKDKAMSEGYKQATVKEELNKNKTFYRVLVGDYDGEEIAQVDLEKLKNSGFSVKVHKYKP